MTVMSDLTKLLPQESETVRKIYEWHERMEAGNDDPHHGRLGASVIGKECERQLWYQFRGLTKETFKGRMLRLFETGHLEEPRFVKELRAIGCTVYDVDEDTGKQFEFTALGGHFVSHPDAIILGVPDAPKTWHVGEFKTMGGTETQLSKDFEKVKRDGVQKAKPIHFAQMQIGMGLGQLTRALYLCKKKATDDLHSERVRYDANEFKRLMEKASRVIRSIGPPERSVSRSDDYRCKWCISYELCWGMSKVAVPIHSKTCRSCCHATPEIDEGEDWARWSCVKNGCDIDLDEQEAACPYHLLLPDLVSFATPTDSGEDWIEFTNENDGACWKHGRAEGMWPTEELMSTPGPEVIAKLDEPEPKEPTLIEKYPPEDCRLIWEGVEDSLGEALRSHIAQSRNVDWPSFEGKKHIAWEFGDRYLAVVYKGCDYAAIWERKIDTSFDFGLNKKGE